MISKFYCSASKENFPLKKLKTVYCSQSHSQTAAVHNRLTVDGRELGRNSHNVPHD